jgi:hypothetical protein
MAFIVIRPSALATKKSPSTFAESRTADMSYANLRSTIARFALKSDYFLLSETLNHCVK